MVIVTLEGGLGNQLFQYAAGRALAAARDTELKLDVRPFEHYTLHRYALAPFRIRESFASDDELNAVTGRSIAGPARLWFRIGQRLRPPHRRRILRESHFRPFDPRVLEAPRDVCLQGYWQSERYFEGIRDVLREELGLRSEPGPRTRELEGEIRGVPSVGVHVRRGDYVTDETTRGVHGVMGPGYYRRAAEAIRATVRDPRYYVFSDDPGWARENLELDGPVTHVDHNGPDRGHEDLHLMSLCRHNIIANSTFSWWAAWRNRNPDKIVLAPSRWFRDASLDTRDLIPAGWRRV
jgi:hypothetical protein